MSVEELMAQCDKCMEEIEQNNILIKEKEQECLEEYEKICQPENVEDTNHNVSSYNGNNNNITSGTVKEINSNELTRILEKNGATTNDGITYNMTVDGHNYGYNVDKHKIIYYDDVNDKGNPREMYCRFFKTDDANIENITNTITLLGGQGALDRNEGEKDDKGNPIGYDLIMKNENKQKNNFFNGVVGRSDSLIIVPYGRGYGQRGADMGNGISGATRVGDFLIDSKNKENSQNAVVGFSLGGQAAFATVANNNGLYSKIVTMNSGIQKKEDASFWSGGSYDNFNGVEIHMYQLKNDDTGLDNVGYSSIKALAERVPNLDLHVHSNSHKKGYDFANICNTYNIDYEELPNDNDEYINLCQNKEISYVEPPTGNNGYQNIWKNHHNGVLALKSLGIVENIFD